jgi:membrane associated rhomboid family serine protease
LGWLQKLPIVSLLLAVALAVIPIRIASVDGQSGELFEVSRETARTYLVRNPQLEVDTLGELILDSTWVTEMRVAAANSESGATVRLPTRMLARSQAQLDKLISKAYKQRIAGDPAWQFGVLDARSPTKNYFIHAFVHESLPGIILTALVLLFVGVALELTWGSFVFALFVVAAIPLTAQSYRLLDASGGVPWSGGAGLAGALLGAYFIRGLGGHFTIPGWILLPAWLGVESFVVRGFWIDDLGSVPWATFCAAVGIGALVAGALRLANFESQVESRLSKRAISGPNPVVVRAARLRSDGDPYQAFDLIQAAWRDDPTCVEIAEAFFSIAVEVGQPDAAAEAIVPSLRVALRKGNVSRAMDYWLPLATKECDVSLEATVAVRLGEALLDASHVKEALFTLAGAVETGVSAAQAIRIVNIARDLDDGLMRRAAIVALNDATLDSKIRAELEAVSVIPSDFPLANEQAETATAAPMESRSQLGRLVLAEHQAIESTAFPIHADTDMDIDPASDGASGESDLNEASLKAQALDAGAFSVENLSEDSSAGENAGDVLSHWNEPDPPARNHASDRSFDFDEDVTDEALFDAPDLDSQEDGIEFGLDLGDSDLLDPLGGETDSDFTPLIDATDELTSPLVSQQIDGTQTASQDGRSTAVFDQPTTFLERPSREALDSGDFSIGGGGGSDASPGPILRSMKALDAVPIAMTEQWVEIDASPRGKSKVPFARIQTVSMAAVGGLGVRPVLIVDVILNGSDSFDEPMKLIRFRSDRFDPLGLEPAAANPLAALIAWVTRLQHGSNAICLPSSKIMDGAFSRFETLEAYERAVLMASREDEG